MKCDKCGYSDNGSGDWAHACGPVKIKESKMNKELLTRLQLEAGGSHYPSINPELQERFAELIVQECCRALNPMLRDMISRGQGVDMIKLHFGMNPKEITTRMLDTAIDQMTKQLAEKKHDS